MWKRTELEKEQNSLTKRNETHYHDFLLYINSFKPKPIFSFRLPKKYFNVRSGC